MNLANRLDSRKVDPKRPRDDYYMYRRNSVGKVNTRKMDVQSTVMEGAAPRDVCLLWSSIPAVDVAKVMATVLPPQTQLKVE
ncbi:hypothetical protein B296_00055192 [Ensete ventricosum]|uniref:Uncharacterized protein n=1 Tax=Ensete ventricosum TaxID=4639 RepID=A0A426Y0S4_ENSVE|nr:hypothetical protein B296_00055192 [Ensete ventricosum]